MKNLTSIDAFDVEPFELALWNEAGYEAQYLIDPDLVGDFDGSGQHDSFDVSGFEALLDDFNIDATNLRQVWIPGAKRYLNDALNPSGYAQVIEESKLEEVSEDVLEYALSRSYTLGLDLIAQFDVTNGNHVLLTDAHGSTRTLTDNTAVAIERYDYNAYGEAIGFVASAALTTYLYSGEQLDAHTGFQYLRARYYDPSNGRFTRLDPFFGDINDPPSK